jgi:hypothetical protein
VFFRFRFGSQVNPLHPRLFGSCQTVQVEILRSLPPYVFGIGVFAGFGWGWGHWGFDWAHRGVIFNHNTYFSQSTTIINRNTVEKHDTAVNHNKFVT